MAIESFKYFKRDISWLSFNRRVLMEAKDESLPIYDRIKFLSIYSSNLEEFYKVRIAGYHSSLVKNTHHDESMEEALETLRQINAIVMEEEKEYYRIFNDMILPDLKHNNIILLQTHNVNAEHNSFIKKYFNEEVFPYLQPMIIQKDAIYSFIQDNRIYQVISLQRKKRRKSSDEEYTFAIMKIPHAQVPRFLELPMTNGFHYIMFIDDVIKANLQSVFPGYDIIDAYSIKISRDADFTLGREAQKDMAERILKKVRKRKIGAITRFQYDSQMPQYFLKHLCEVYEIENEELLPAGKYLNMADLMLLPNPVGEKLCQQLPSPLRIPELDHHTSILNVLRKHDILLHFPYHSFDYLLRFLLQAAFDPKVREIKITQYRVAENSAVINSLISAAKNGKKVTVFVELKARFDEENNFHTSEMMQRAGIKIIYSLPKLKVHAKIAYVRKHSKDKDNPIKGYVYLGTGNFNEKTARIYSDKGLLSSNKNLITEIDEVFRILEGNTHKPEFQHIMVAQFNMVDRLLKLINNEIAEAKKGNKARMILKMNSLQDQKMIDALYNASLEGVEIDLIIRGICCLIPNQSYSKNIKITRIVDAYLEHSRVWYFYNKGEESVYLTSADWMERNLYRRIEVAFPVYCEKMKKEIIDILQIQLADNQSAVWITEDLKNERKQNNLPPVRAQQATYQYLRTIANKGFEYP